MDPERRQQAKHHVWVFDRQLCQLIMLVQRSVWGGIEAPTDPDKGATAQKLLERVTCDADPGELMCTNHPLLLDKFERHLRAG
jgi:hypothetical protein